VVRYSIVFYYGAVIPRRLRRGYKAKSKVSAEPNLFVKYPPRYLAALLRGRVHFLFRVRDNLNFKEPLGLVLLKDCHSFQSSLSISAPRVY
jgi:hypothetical protein